MEIDEYGLSLEEYIDGIKLDTSILNLIGNTSDQLMLSYEEFVFGLQTINETQILKNPQIGEIIFDFADKVYLYLNNFGLWNSVRSYLELFLKKFKPYLAEGEYLKLLLYLGVTKNNLGLYIEAQDHIHNIISIWEKGSKKTDIGASAYFQMGVCQVRQNKLSKAHDYLIKSINSCSSSQLNIKGFSYVQIGNIKMLQGNPHEAKENYMKSLIIFENDNQSTDLACTAYDALGRLYVLEQNYQKAIPYIEKGLEIRKRRNELSGEINASVQLADAFIGLNQLENATVLLNKLTAIFEESNKKFVDPIGKTLLFVSLGRLAKAEGSSDLAIDYWERAINENESKVPSVDLRILSLLIPELALKKRGKAFFKYILFFIKNLVISGISPFAFGKLLLTYSKGIIFNKFEKNKKIL